MIPVTSVLAQHAEEAAFQWLLRDLAAQEAHYSLQDLADLDSRLEANLDGLRIARDAGWVIILKELGWREPGEVFVATVLACESGDLLRLEEVLAAAMDERELGRAAVSGLGWLTTPVAIGYAGQLLNADDPLRQWIGLGGMAAHRHDPGEPFRRLLELGESLVRRRALKAAGELGRADLLGVCQAALDAKEENVRFWGAWSATLLGDRTAGTRALYELALDDAPRAERAADLLARSMQPDRVLAWHRRLAEEGERPRLACRVAGALGDPAVVPWLLDMMEVDEVARPAGEAFSMITGLDLAYEDLERDWPEGFEAGPTESPEDEDVELDPDENLPWPDPELVAGWWADHGSRFSAGTRYLLGETIAPAGLGHALRHGFQRQRAAAALELALLEPEAPLFEVRARGDRQRRLLGV